MKLLIFSVSYPFSDVHLNPAGESGRNKCYLGSLDLQFFLFGRGLARRKTNSTAAKEKKKMLARRSDL